MQVWLRGSWVEEPLDAPKGLEVSNEKPSLDGPTKRCSIYTRETKCYRNKYKETVNSSNRIA